MEDERFGKEMIMKKRLYLLLCSSIFVIGGCTSNHENQPTLQEDTKVSDNKTGAELMNENESVGIIEFFNSTPKTILYGISGSDVNKNSEVKAVYIIEKGKMTRYILKGYKDNTLSALKSKSDEEILKIAQEYDKKYFEQRKEKKINAANEGITLSEENISSGKDDEDYGQRSLGNYKAAKEFYSNLTYKQFRKPNSDIKLKSDVWTDSSGNYVSQETLIHMPYVDILDISVDFEWTKAAVENEIKKADYVDTKFQSTPTYESMPYIISGEQWVGIRTENMLLSRQLVKKKISFGLDKIGTKNVTEKD
ncbi:hypothetical protein [Streptococcus cristatus]|jgi:lipoprotein|uniref:hypothetical protein n=1 Tax=Streptococcus cristatus TaxID=45634 RepID=UPI0011F26644|nr:hypothetical protein [Streptococcus cristatus]